MTNQDYTLYIENLKIIGKYVENYNQVKLPIHTDKLIHKFISPGYNFRKRKEFQKAVSYEHE